MYTLGRQLQLLGLIVLPISILIEISGSIEGWKLWNSLTLAIFGVLAFSIGYLLQGSKK